MDLIVDKMKIDKMKTFALVQMRSNKYELTMIELNFKLKR